MVPGRGGRHRLSTWASVSTFGGGSFELRSVTGNCATFLFGDEPFTLCANSTK